MENVARIFIAKTTVINKIFHKNDTMIEEFRNNINLKNINREIYTKRGTLKASLLLLVRINKFHKFVKFIIFARMHQ